MVSLYNPVYDDFSWGQEYKEQTVVLEEMKTCICHFVEQIGDIKGQILDGTRHISRETWGSYPQVSFITITVDIPL